MRGMANSVRVLIMENNLHVLRRTRRLATEEINYGARITSMATMTSNYRASPSSGIIATRLDKFDAAKLSRRASCSLFLFRANSNRGFDVKFVGFEIIRQRSDNDTFRSVKTMTALRPRSGVKRGIVLVAHPPVEPGECPFFSLDISRYYCAL